MKKSYSCLVALFICCICSAVHAWNPAIYDESRWVEYYPNNKFDSKSITYVDNRFIYVWVFETKENILSMLCIDLYKKKKRYIDMLCYEKNNDISFVGFVNNKYYGESCIKSEMGRERPLNILDQALVERIYDKDNKRMKVMVDKKVAVIPASNREKWGYLSDLSTNVWKHIGGRELSYEDDYGEIYQKDSLVFYYDQQNIKYDSGKKGVWLWLKYRYVENDNISDEPKFARYGLSHTYIDLNHRYYFEDVLLSYDSNGILETDFANDINISKPIVAGTAMDIVYETIMKTL